MTQQFVTRRGTRHPLPLFMPVYQPRQRAFQLALDEPELVIDGLIVNAFFLYKQRELRERLTHEESLAQYVGFDGLICTDSGAFQGFTRQLYLANKDIVRFQDQIGSDVIAPLDVVTPPGDNRSVAEAKLRATQKRIREALTIVRRGMVAGVQQGGRFLDLRHRSICELMEMHLGYLAIGSLVPFFTSNHDLRFVGQVLRDVRSVAGDELPVHVYGAGDPCELPFMVALGATVFDSASYGHFARDGWYMTPYGALADAGPVIAGEYRCGCRACSTAADIRNVFADADALSRHNLWTICTTVAHLRMLLDSGGGLDGYLRDVLQRHSAWFPGSALASSWQALSE